MRHLKWAVVFAVSLAGALTGVSWRRGLLDRAPPVIRVELPEVAHAHRGKVTFTVVVEDAFPAHVVLTGQLDTYVEKVLPSGTVPIDTRALPDGLHRLTVRATDGSWFRNTTSQVVDFETDNTAPEVWISEASLSAVQGRTLGVYIRTSEPLSEISGEFLNKGRTFYPVGEPLWRALVGLPIESEAGVYPLHLTLSDLSGNQSSASVPVDVLAGTFPAGGTIRLTPAQVAARRDDLNRAKTRKERGDVYRHRLADALWTGVMLRPTAGRLTSGFGRYRTYSDGRRSYHYGTDLASPTGTVVIAAAAGIVRQAGWQHIFGNVVIIDHGQGVSTSYNHLSTVDVVVGDRVAAGDLVGKVGSTGQSTGPHLHWGLVVDGVSVDAEEWLSHDFLGDQEDTFTDVAQLNGGAVWSEE